MITQYILFSQLPNGSHFCFEIDEIVRYAIKTSEDSWMYNTRVEGENKKGVYIAPLSDEWIVECL